MNHQQITQPLIDACLSGQRTAQRRLYDLSLPRLSFLAQRYCQAESDVRDALQDSYLAIFDNLTGFDPGKAAFLTWAGRITIHACLKRNRRRVRARNEGVPLGGHEETLCPEPGPLERLTDEELLSWLKLMPHDYYVVFNLHAVEGYGHPAVAQLLGISPALARQRYAPAKKWLRHEVASGEWANCSTLR